MLSHAMPYTFIFGLGASTWPKASEPWAEEGAGFCFFWFGTWPKASEPQARAGELAPGLPPRPRALRLR